MKKIKALPAPNEAKLKRPAESRTRASPSGADVKLVCKQSFSEPKAKASRGSRGNFVNVELLFLKPKLHLFYNIYVA